MLFIVLRISSGMGGGLDTMLCMVLRTTSGGGDSLLFMLVIALSSSTGMGVRRIRNYVRLISSAGLGDVYLRDLLLGLTS